ncbi:MAG: serine hydrolase domain-containing protein [Marinicellaceae bacterium]
MKNIIILLALTLSLSACHNEVETPLTLNQGAYLNDLHKNNVGKIAFMNDWIAIDAFDQKHFVEQLKFNNTTDLNFRMFLDKTLTYYLSQLEPELPVRELCDKGNFQLTFIVDDFQVYQYNLQTGAGSCDYKNDTTVYGIPLVHKNNPDHWGRFLWMKFIKKGGGEQALSGDSHQLKIEIRPYIQHKDLKVGEIIAQGEVNLITTENAVDSSQLAIQSIATTNNWDISNFQYDQSLIKELNKKIAQKYFKDITSIAVIKEGELLLEQYFNGADRNSLHDMRSVGKTLASTVMGVAIKDGFIKNDNQTLSDFYDLKDYQNHALTKEKVTLKSLLTMSSGVDGSDMDSNSAGNEDNMYPTKDWVKFALDLPMNNNKEIGKNWDYFTAGAVVLGDILNQVVPDGLYKYSHEKLFKPLGIKEYKWQFTPTNVPNTAGGFQMSTLDNARWGQLYLDNGRYKDEQILPEEWVHDSLKKHVSIPDRDNEYYGYLLWNKTYTINNQNIESFYASGNGGNRIMIFNDLGVIIVITATAYNQPYAHFQSDEIIEKHLLPAILIDN